MTFQRILVGVDFSAASVAAVEAALAYVADSGRVQIHHVVGTSAVHNISYPWATDWLYAHREDRAENSLAALLAEARNGRGAGLFASVARGAPAAEILWTAKRTSADLVVIGARGRRALGWTLGSVAHQVVRESPVPVLVVPEGPPVTRPARILLADGRDETTAAASLAAASAARFFGAPLEALHVIEGPPAAAILEVARPPDLIVCGTRGQGALGRLVLGSVATELMRGARCPVLVVGSTNGVAAALPDAVLHERRRA